MPLKIPLPGSGPAFAEFVMPARQSPELWRLFVGLGLTVAGITVTLIVPLVLFVALVTDRSIFDISFALRIPSLAEPVWVLWMLVCFGGLALGAGLAAHFVHRRSPLTLICAPGRPLVRHFAIGALVATAVLAPASAIVILWTDPYRNMALSVWLLWLVPAVPAVFLQTFSEEILFRGYLQQQLAARFSSRWMWWFLPSFIFGALHFDPLLYGVNAPLVALLTMMFGLIAADVTARTGSIGIAVGLHFANNMFALCLFGLDNGVSGLSLYLLPGMTNSRDPGLSLIPIVDLVSLCIAYAVFLAVVAYTRRKAAAQDQSRLPS